MGFSITAGWTKLCRPYQQCACSLIIPPLISSLCWYIRHRRYFASTPPMQSQLATTTIKNPALQRVNVLPRMDRPFFCLAFPFWVLYCSQSLGIRLHGIGSAPIKRFSFRCIDRSKHATMPDDTTHLILLDVHWVAGINYLQLENQWIIREDRVATLWPRRMSSQLNLSPVSK